MTNFFEIIKFIIIGIVQGITEILPISSSGHLAITYDLLKINTTNQLDITIYLHLASSIALLIFFKDTLIKLIKGTCLYIFKKDKSYFNDFKLMLFLILSSIPVAIVGFILKPIVESFFQNIVFVSIGFLITAIVLLIISKMKTDSTNNYTFKNTFITGLIQCASIFPGISRSGITLFGSKVAKMNQKKGKEYTFLLLIPISFGSSLLAIFDTDFSTQIANNTIYLYLLAMIVAFIFTFLSLKYFFNSDLTKSYKKYVFYLLFLGLFTLIMYI